MDLRKTVRKFIKEKGLIDENGGRVLVALSGGPDSVALLHVLHSLGYDCVAVHVNFHLRGSESDRDEAFAVKLCSVLGVPCRVEHLYAAEYATENHVSIEMAAREMRYARFEEIREALHLDCIAVGHHRDDNVETFFLNLLRGSGIKGLVGIRPRNGYIVRPLLSVSRKDVLYYLSENELDYVTDHTNLEPDCKRNKIRLQLMPLLQEIEPAAPSAIDRSMGFLSEAEELYALEIDGALKRLLSDGKSDCSVLDNTPCSIIESISASASALASESISVSALEQERVPKGILNVWLSPYGFNTRTIVDVWNQRREQTGRLFESPTHRLLLDRGHLVLQSKEECEKAPDLVYEIIEVKGRTVRELISKDPRVATLDADKVSMPLSLRHPKPSDRFVPYGMHGSKLVSDYLTDLKLSRFEKGQTWLLVTSSDDIVWVVGHRIAAPYAVTPSTVRILRSSTA